MTHYPHQDGPVDDEFGLAPHTDTSFLTLLAPNDVPGLSIRTQSGKWIDAPAIADAYVVNGGQMLQRWTNDVFLATPHRAINRSGGERYAIPFFCDSNIDWPVAAVPTTRRPRQAARNIRRPGTPTTWSGTRSGTTTCSIRKPPSERACRHHSRHRSRALSRRRARRAGSHRGGTALRADRDRLLLHRQSRRAATRQIRERLRPGRALPRPAARRRSWR